MPGALLPSRMRQTLPSGGSEAPPPDVGFFEGIGAAFRSAEDRQDLFTQMPRNADAYRDLLDSLGDMGVDTSRNGALYMDVKDSMGFTRRIMDRDAIIKEVNRRKAQNTAHFTKVPATREEFDMAVANRFGESQRDEERASAAGFVPSLIGGAASAMTDPINLATLPVGGGTTFARTVLIGGVVSGITEAALLPDTKRAMDRGPRVHNSGRGATSRLCGGGRRGFRRRWLRCCQKLGRNQGRAESRARKAVDENRASFARIDPAQNGLGCHRR